MPESLGVSVTSFGSGQTVDENGNLYYWFSPIDVLHGLTFGEGPVWEFWCEACGGVWQPQLLNANQFQISDVPVFPCLTPEGVNGGNLCDVASQWLYSSMWRFVTGGQERECGPPLG